MKRNHTQSKKKFQKINSFLCFFIFDSMTVDKPYRNTKKIILHNKNEKKIRHIYCNGR